MLSAATLYQRGVDLGNAGRHAAARRELLRAAERDPDPDLKALISGILAYIESETGDPDAGILLCGRALADVHITAHTRAVLAGQLGLIELRRGNSAAALAHLSAAAARLGADPARQGRVLLNRGLVRLDRGELSAAQGDFERAAEDFRASGEPVEEAKATNNQGYTAMLAGDLVTAIRLMDRSSPVLSTLSPVSAAVGDADRAEVMLAAGMTTEAVALLRAVVRTYGGRRLRQAQAEAELALARALALESPQEASVVARRAARRFRGRGSETWAVRADGLALMTAIAGGRGGVAVERAAARSVRALLGIRRLDDAAALHLQLARAQLRNGRASDARATASRVRLRASAPIGTRILREEVRVELAEAAGSASAVMRRAAAGLDQLQEWQSTFGSIELQSSARVHGRILAHQGVRAALSTGRPEVVFDWSERVRLLSSRIAGVRAPADQEAADELAELRLIRASSPSPRTAAARRESELRDRIRRRHWTDEASGAVSLRASLADTEGALADDGAVLLAPLWTADGASILVVSATSSHLVDLGPLPTVAGDIDALRADLDMSALSLPSDLHRAVSTSLDARLARIDHMLLAPAAAMLGDAHRVVITPSGAFAGIPWGMLPTLVGRAVTVPDSATGWLADRGRGAHILDTGFVAGPGVSRAVEEVRASAGRWTGSVSLTGADATADAVSRLAGSVNLLHVAAHGRHSADNPLFSAFELSDGAWFGYDIDQLQDVPSVVILSACEMGRSASRWGLEALGMSRAWLHAGARTVISSPVVVSDDVAAILLQSTHEYLAMGRPPAEALAAASGETGISAPFLCHGSGW
ncbi:tetratricopeptide (TPR) repeat protein [Salinibacterium sp. CAN_S4]|uniref:CHAT domain-containing protein n=1 Tax=Salinibacterium sp. CAN_S4 TaxID=2787727 RepID=UPI0018EF7DD3